MKNYDHKLLYNLERFSVVSLGLEGSFVVKLAP